MSKWIAENLKILIKFVKIIHQKSVFGKKQHIYNRESFESRKTLINKKRNGNLLIHCSSIDWNINTILLRNFKT